MRGWGGGGGRGKGGGGEHNEQKFQIALLLFKEYNCAKIILK